MSDLSGWDPAWDIFMAERDMKRRKPTSLAYNDMRKTVLARWVGRTDSLCAGNSFQARNYSALAGADGGTNGWLATGWVSPAFPDPITAFVYAELNNWGQ
jgi:hypothetical protein